MIGEILLGLSLVVSVITNVTLWNQKRDAEAELEMVVAARKYQ